jgi:hypothetical protein
MQGIADVCRAEITIRRTWRPGSKSTIAALSDNFPPASRWMAKTGH